MVEENGSRLANSSQDILSKTLLEQSANLRVWLNEDSHLLDEYVAIQTFQGEEHYTTNWTKHPLETTNYSNIFLLQQSQEKLLSSSDENGLNISNHLLFPNLLLNLRSLAADIRLRVKLSQQSRLEVILRASEQLTDHCPVIRISKDLEKTGTLVRFGTINLQENLFVAKKSFNIFENCQESCSDLDVHFIDNGDDTVYLNIKNFSKAYPSKPASLSCENYLPVLQNSKVCLIGTGSSCILKSISIKYRARIKRFSKNKRKDCVCSIF